MSDPGQFDAFWSTVDKRIDARVAQALEQFAKSHQARGPVNVAITTGATGIPLVGDVTLTSPQAFVRVPFPFQLTEVYACLDVVDSVQWTIEVFFPTAIGGSGPASGVDPTGGTFPTVAGREDSFDPRGAAAWTNTFFPAGSNIALYVVAAGGLAGILTVNLIGRTVY